MTRYIWKHLETDIQILMTSQDIEDAYNAIGIYPEQLADMLTGYNCDSYADDAEGLIDFCGGDVELAKEDDEDTYNRCRAYHRLLNPTLDEETCEECWLKDFKRTSDD